MSWSYDLTTDVGKVRALITDTNANRQILSNEEIQVFLDLRTDGARVSDALLKRAERLRAQADTDETNAYPGFEIAEWAPSDFAGAEWLARYGSWQ